MSVSEHDIKLAARISALEATNAALVEAVEAACHSAGIVGDFIPLPPPHEVTERQWATQARAALKLAKGDEQWGQFDEEPDNGK